MKSRQNSKNTEPHLKILCIHLFLTITIISSLLVGSWAEGNNCCAQKAWKPFPAIHSQVGQQFNARAMVLLKPVVLQITKVTSERVGDLQ